MVMTMRGLETVATATLVISCIPFASAWHAQGAGGRKYRNTIRNLWRLTIVPVVTTAGLLSGLLATLLAPFDPRSINNLSSLKSYRYRRSYRGRHFTGENATRVTARIRAERDAMAA